jgi:GT2 family glycosyltransferase
MKLGFVILAHNQPDAVRRLVDILAGAGHRVVVHFDTSAPADQQAAVRSLEQAHPALVRVVSKVHCVWGEWSLVDAVLVALREFERMPEKPDYIHLMSGADFPIRPITDLQEFLRRNPDKDFIECCDVTQRRWVKGGLSMERFRFFFPVNFRTSRKTFDRLVRWHRKLKIRRRIPLAMTPHMGSQWWTMRWSTCAKVLDFLRANPQVVRYFRSTWIPDESFFQTVVAHLVPRREIVSLQLMFHHLTPTGRPYVFHRDHLPVIRKLPHFFIRKVAPQALVEVEQTALNRASRLPSPRHLARVRDIVRDAIDRSYTFSSIVPGFPQGPAAGNLRQQPHFLVVLAPEGAALARIAAMVRSHPGAFWFGRPFAPGRLSMPPAVFRATGLAPGLASLRESLPAQFVDTLTAAAPLDRVPVIALVPGRDEIAFEALGRLPNVSAIRTPDAPADGMKIPWPTQAVDVGSFRAYLDDFAISRFIPRTPMNGPTDSPGTPQSPPRLEVQHLGHIGNYFHVEGVATLPQAVPLEVEYVIPGNDQALRPEAAFTGAPDADGRQRFVHLFWSKTAAPASSGEPALALLTSDVDLAPPPVVLPSLAESSPEDFVALVSSVRQAGAWTHRVTLETIGQLPLVQRLGFLRAALAHAGWDEVESGLPSMAGSRHPDVLAIHRLPLLIVAASMQVAGAPDDCCEPIDRLTGNLPLADIRLPVLHEAIDLLASHSLPAACRLARRVILSRPLSISEVLSCLQPCLPRDSRWWLPTLDRNASLGAAQLADALNCAASAASSQGETELARLCLHAARLIDPSAQSPAWNLGLLLASEGEPGAAVDSFRAVRRHYSSQSIATLWPAKGGTPWPFSPWPTDSYALPDGVTAWPRITVVTPSFNQGPYIEETLLSVLHQNYPNLQYIVVDGNSTDETRGILERYRDRIDHLIIEADEGQTQAINKGLRLADGEIITWLNSDDMQGPGTLHQAALHWLASGADVVAGICAEHRARAFAVINKPSATDRDFNPAQLARIFPHWFAGMYFFQPEVFFTRTILEKAGLLDESLHYAMDYDLWLRFAKAGARLEVVCWPFAFFRLHAAQKTARAVECLAEQAEVRNRHHPLEPRDERRHQIERQLAALRARPAPRIALLVHRFASLFTAAATADGWVMVTDPTDPVLGRADAVMVAIGSDRAEIPLLQSLRRANPDRLIAGWFLEQNRDPHANHAAAENVDLIIPTDARTGDYLRNDFAMMGPAIDRPENWQEIASWLAT